MVLHIYLNQVTRMKVGLILWRREFVFILFRVSCALFIILFVILLFNVISLLESYCYSVQSTLQIQIGVGC